jgi:hypothetical protein
MSKEWKLVPVEPTDDMKEAGAPSCEYTGTVCAALCYEAMIAAAPAPPQDDAQPVAGQSRFTSQKDWQPCSYEHHLMVIANPSEWPGYETRALFTRSDAGEVESLQEELAKTRESHETMRADLIETDRKLTSAEQWGGILERAVFRALDDSSENATTGEITIMRADYEALVILIGEPTESGEST